MVVDRSRRLGERQKGGEREAEGWRNGRRARERSRRKGGRLEREVKEWREKQKVDEWQKGRERGAEG